MTRRGLFARIAGAVVAAVTPLLLPRTQKGRELEVFGGGRVYSPDECVVVAYKDVTYLADDGELVTMRMHRSPEGYWSGTRGAQIQLLGTPDRKG